MFYKFIKNPNPFIKRCLGKILVVTVLLTWGCRKTEEPTDTPKTRQEFPVVGKINIIPQPKTVKRIGGEFELNKDTKIVAADETAVKMAVNLNSLLMENYGLTLDITKQAETTNSIALLTAPENAAVQAKEGYILKIEPEQIRISGTETGLFYGIQSLKQLLPLDFAGGIKIPAAEISDTPRFPYRGMHLDVARHFMPVEFIKKYIVLMSRYKFNYFHWHLTDDQGWRVEIKKYPRLTTVGSKRRETVVGKNYRPYVGDGVPIEGFYTQEQIRDVVEFAKARYITIIPEIDLPGHSSAALAAYPEYGCKPNYPYSVKTTWGGFADIYCPTEPTFNFIEDVLDEVINLFPNSPYIHIGGDEVILDHWKNSATVNEFKKQENLKNEKEVQSRFIRRIEKFVNSKGKKIIGWDDILGEGIEPSATIMSWRGFSYGIQAVRARHDVIMTPSDYTYLDRPQSDEKSEPLALGKQLTLNEVYNFDPIPPELKPEESRFVIGGQGCIWTEFIKKSDDVEYMAFPRVLALAESLWSFPENKNFTAFSERLSAEFPKLDRLSVNYRIQKPHGFDDKVIALNDAAMVALNFPPESGKIYYTLDGKNPNAFSEVYNSPFVIDVKPNKTVEIKAKIITPEGRESSVFTAKYTRQTKTSVRSP